MTEKLIVDRTKKGFFEILPGEKPVAVINEAQKFAEKMGYRWQTNEHPDLA